MANIGSILSIARGAVAAHQVAMQTVAQNIANAEVEGYSRQRAELVPGTPMRLPGYSIGTGVTVDSVIRLRDQLLDASYRREAGGRESYAMRMSLLGEIEGVLGEPSETGLANTLDQFWNSWNDLANNPGNATAQGVVRQRGQQVAYTLNTYGTRLDDLTNRTRDRLSNTIAELNTLAIQVAEVNRTVTAAEVGGVMAPDLRDTRDRLADKLSQMAGVRVEMQKDGTMGVYLGTMMLVDRGAARTLEVQAGTPITVGYVGDPDPIMGVGGEIGEMLHFLNTEVPAVRARLDALARGLVNGVNEYHAAGWTAAGDALGGGVWPPAAGPTGSRVNFFDPAFVTAGTIRLSSEVTANAAVIASGDVQNAPGNNSIALALGALRDDAGMAALQTRMGAAFATQIGFGTGESFGDHYESTVSTLGVQAANARDHFAIHDTLATQAENRRVAVAGVSIDEELGLMLRHQQAYSAATRLIRVADEMAQTLLSMV